MKFFYAALTVGLQIAHVLECEMKSENGQWENGTLLKLMCLSQAIRAAHYHCSF